MQYLSGEFSMNIGQNQIVTLQTPDGKQWGVWCYYYNPPSLTMRMGKGWTAFSRDNNLEEGDACVFEVKKRKHVVLSVTIFHVVDYQSSD